VTVVSGDIDPDAGVAVVRLVSHPGHDKGTEYTVLIERCGEEWRSGGDVGAGGVADVPPPRGPAGSPGQVAMIELNGGGGTLSLAHRLEHPGDRAGSPWVRCATLRAAAEVDHVLFGERRLDLPASGVLTVVWKSPPLSPAPIRPGPRPRVVAMDRDGVELSSIGPEDHMDSYTWATLAEHDEQDG
jgi:hypothetical protein